MENSQQIPMRENPEEKDFTCQICTEITSKNKKFKNKDLCKHPFCVDCVAKYAQVKIEDDETAEIECPGLDCKQLLDPLSCRLIIEPSLFSKWCDLLFENYVLGFEKILCPNKNCMALVVKERGDRGESHGRKKKAKCPTCKQWFCLRCKLVWHEGYSCEENRNFGDPNDILYGQLIKTIACRARARVRCPGCGHCVERKDCGRTIACRCKIQLCHGCGQKHPCLCDTKLEDLGMIILSLLLLAVIFLII